MDPIQSKVIDLLQEIHNTCEQLNISYILGGNTAEEAECFGKLTPGRYTATVYITLKDFLAFREYVKANRHDDRIIEGMDNNSRFPGFFFHYADKNTTYYDYNYGDSYIYNGIRIRIEILRKFTASKKAGRLKKKERAFAFNSYRFKRKLSVKNTLAKWGMGFRLAFARKSIARKLYNKCLDLYMEDKDFVMNYGIFNKRKTKLVKYPSYLLTGRKTAELEGHSFYVPQDLELHTKIALGRKPLEQLPEQINNSSVVVSDIISYEEYMKDMSKRRKIAKMRQSLWRTDQMHGAVTYFIRKDWKIMLCVNARLDLIKEYMPVKNQIIELYSKGDFEGLTELLADYDEQVRYHLSKTGMTIFFDKEIFDIYLVWLTQNNGARLVGKMRKSVPKEWK